MVKIKIKDKNDEKNQINFLYVYENEFDSAIDYKIQSEILRKKIKSFYRFNEGSSLDRFSKMSNIALSNEVAKIAKHIVGQYEFFQVSDINKEAYIFSHLVENPDAFKNSLEKLTSLYGVSNLSDRPILAIIYANKRGILNIVNDNANINLLVSIEVDVNFSEKKNSIYDVDKMFLNDLFDTLPVKSKFSQKSGLVTGYSHDETNLNDIKYFNMLEDFFWNEFEHKLLCGRIVEQLEKSENKEREEEAIMDNENIVSDSDYNIDLNEELLKALENRYKLQTTAVYECKSLDTICKLIKYMPKKDNKMLKTMIYKMKNKYYFSNSCLKNTSLFCEYNVCETYISASYIKEHGRRINNFAALLSL